MASLAIILILILTVPRVGAMTQGTSPGASLLVPLYSAPGSEWAELAHLKASHPSVGVYAIVNPDNGPGVALDSTFGGAVSSLESAGVVVLGYIPTSYCSRNLTADVEPEVSRYINWYGVHSIFLDEMPSLPGSEGYYSNITAYAKSSGVTYVVGNPGSHPSPTYLGTVDSLVVYEGSGVPNLDLSSAYPGSKASEFAAIAFGVPSICPTPVSQLISQVGLFYLTDESPPNPYEGAPSYLSALFSILDPSTRPSTLTVTALSESGSNISGPQTALYCDGSLVSTGTTPADFQVMPGSTYTLVASDYGQLRFDHWGNGNYSLVQHVTTYGNQTLTAYYSLSSQVDAAPSTAVVPVWAVILSVGGFTVLGCIFVLGREGRLPRRGTSRRSSRRQE